MADVLRATSPRGGSPTFVSPAIIHRDARRQKAILVDTASLPESKTSYYHDSDQSISSATSSEPSSPRVDKSSVDSTPPSSISLDHHDDDELFFPTYGDRANSNPRTDCPPPASPTTDDYAEISTPSTSGDSIPASPPLKPADDTAVHDEPSRQVDYLSHDWHEEDIWQSWRHIVSNRRKYGERSRLENASWRTWTKAKYSLKTVSPEKLNWLKDCDVTWLYGPLQEARHSRARWAFESGRRPSAISESHSEPNGRLSKTDSFLKKPILKKRSVSEVMLQKSLSSSSLVKQAAAAVQAQRSSMVESRPRLPRSASEGISRSTSVARTATTCATLLSSSSCSGLQSPENGVKKHIRFDDTVEQCIAVEYREGQEEDDPLTWSIDEASSSEDDIVMMKGRPKWQSSLPGSRRESFGQESKGIAMLPSTTLKYHRDETHDTGFDTPPPTPGWQAGRLQHSSSQETLRPTRPNANFLLNDEDEDISWEPSGAFSTPRPGPAGGEDNGFTAECLDAPKGLRRTASGMFMPFDDEDEHAVPANGMIGRVIDTVNTARDIFSVIVNVGWRN